MTPIIHAIFFFAGLTLITGTGFMVWYFCFASKKDSLLIETLLFSFVLGIGCIDFLMITLGTFGIPLSGPVLVSILGLILTIGWLARRKIGSNHSSRASHCLPLTHAKPERILFLVLFALTLLMKTIYLSDAIVPTATDLGHHLYWVKTITETHALPLYQERNIIDQSGNIYLTEPAPIADFIIGEHLPFAALALLTTADLLSAFPIVFLLLINIASLFALVVLAYRLVKGSSLVRFIRPELAALSALFLFGPLYTLASPQAKFVSGGVIGNIFGNLFLPLILLLFLRAFQEKDDRLLGFGFLLTFTLAYTHHLSMLILLYILAGSTLILIVSYRGHLKNLLLKINGLIFKPIPLTVAFLSIGFFLVIAMPTYIETHAIDTAIGTPTKSTRTGLSINQIIETAGEARFALGLAGLFLVLISLRRSLAASLLLGWTVTLFLMSFRPHWLFLDIPSNRIGTYFVFPIGIAAAIGLAWFITISYKKHASLPTLFLLCTIFTFSIASGLFDNGQRLLTTPKSTEAVETFAASRFLAQHVTHDDIILKDHNYLTADTWMKHFFLRDYSFPLSRGYFSRYENTDRERCTLDMIAIPNTPRAEACFAGTGVNYLVVNPRFDAPQFEKSPQFSRVYASDKIHVYVR